MRKLNHSEILERQKEKVKEKRLPIAVILNDIRSLHNVGAIFRTADGAGVEKIYLCGITGYPPNAQIQKTSLGAEKVISWEYRKNPIELIESLKKDGYEIVLLEQAKESILYQDFKPSFPVCFVIGNEISGVNEGIVSFCDKIIEIEMSGIKNSLNVSVAFGIAVYHIRNCFFKDIIKIKI